MVYEFEITNLRDHHNRGLFIFARQLNYQNSIEIKEGALLEGIPIYHYKEMYPILDDQANPQYDLYVFRPIWDSFPRPKFYERQIVKLINPG